MAGNRKTRKAYKRKYVAQNVLDVFGGMGSTHGEHLRGIQIKTYRALDEMTQGRGTREGWDLLVGAINMANVMCEQGIGSEFRDQTIAAREALLEVGKRIVRTERVVLKGEELKAIRAALECHDAQLENVRAIDVDRAYVEVQRRIRERVNTTNVIAELAQEGA
jgi:hypothetical protein